MNLNFNNSELGGFLFALAIATFLATAVIHIVFAVGVYRAAAHRYEDRGVHFAPPFVWALATLIGGVFVATAFWFIHLSALSTPSPIAELEPDL